MITVIIKRSRITNHLKCWAGVLNPAKHYYVNKAEGNTVKQVKEKLNGHTA